MSLYQTANIRGVYCSPEKAFEFSWSILSTSLVQITVVSLANLHKRPEALARYYVTSYWQAEWVKKLRWKTIELPPPSWITVGSSSGFNVKLLHDWSIILISRRFSLRCSRRTHLSKPFV